MTIKVRIFLGFSVLLVAGTAALARWLASDISLQPLRATEESLVETATLLASVVANSSQPGALDLEPLRQTVAGALSSELAARIYELDKTSLSLRVYATDTQGLVVYDSDGGRAQGQDYSQWNDVARTLKGEYGARATRSDPSDFYSTVLFVAAPIRVDGQLAGVVAVGKPVASLKLFMAAASRNVVMASLVAALIAALASLLIATWITAPVRRLATHAEAIASGRRPPLPNLGAGEIAALGQAFETMRDALEGKHYVEDYIRSLTHEIKGPLSAIRAAGELLEEEGMPQEDRQRFFTNIRTESARLQLLVDRLLELAAVEARKSLHAPAAFDVVELVQDVVASAHPLARQKSLLFDVETPERLSLHGDRLLIRQALFNLVRNAIAATPGSGKITLQVHADPDRVSFEVLDTGPGIPAFALPRVFEKFYSLASTPEGDPGTGLGLPFVREVALLHGGEASIENRPAGGARAMLRLPLQQPTRPSTPRPLPA